MATVNSSTSKSGIAVTSTGERHIPASTRADGSIRKEIKVRPGYRPPEDVEVYKNRTAEAFKSRGKGGVPGADFINTTPEPKSLNKNAKRREARKKIPDIAPASGSEKQVGESGLLEASIDTNVIPVDPEVQKEKEARKLCKKLRQARDLQKKTEGGDSLLPEQFEKVIRIKELIRQLDQLGFNTDGEKITVQEPKLKDED